MNALTLACDPGLRGGFAWIAQEQVQAAPMPPGDAALVAFLEELVLAREVEVWIEEPPLFAGRNLPASRIAKLYGNFRFLEGYFSRCHARVLRVRPQTWQKYFHLGTRREAGSPARWKAKLRDEAQRRFPSVTVTLATADALLILDYAIDREA